MIKWNKTSVTRQPKPLTSILTHSSPEISGKNKVVFTTQTQLLINQVRDYVLIQMLAAWSIIF
jgi:hypothetical protein